MVRVMASGVFDILHSGHLHYLRYAKSQGDELVVVIANDATVRRKKHEPIIPDKMRLELVQELKPVDMAMVGHDGNIFDIVDEIRPDVIILGYDQRFGEQELEKLLAERGLDVRVLRAPEFTDDLNATRHIIRKVIDWHSGREEEDA